MPSTQIFVRINFENKYVFKIDWKQKGIITSEINCSQGCAFHQYDFKKFIDELFTFDYVKKVVCELWTFNNSISEWQLTETKEYT